MATISLDEEQFKNLLKETLVEIFEERQDLFSAIVAEAMEEIGLANAIRAGRKNDFVDRERIDAILGEWDMEILFERSFERDLKKIRSKRLLKQVRDVIHEVEAAARLSDITNVKKLHGFDSYYRIRVGDYRIGIELSEGEVIFVRVLARKEIYRYFP
jgi:mRNA interferase RelE/StbE